MYQDSKQVSKCNCSNMFLNRPLYFHKTTIDTWSSSLQFCQVIFTTSVNTIFRPRQNIEALKGVFGRRDSFWSKFKFDWDTGHMYVECRVTTESVPRKLAQYRVVMTAAEFWSHSAPAHTCHPRRLESHPTVKVPTTFRRNNIWIWCLIAPCWKPLISFSHLQMFKYPFMRVS